VGFKIGTWRPAAALARQRAAEREQRAERDSRKKKKKVHFNHHNRVRKRWKEFNSRAGPMASGSRVQEEIRERGIRPQFLADGLFDNAGPGQTTERSPGSAMFRSRAIAKLAVTPPCGIGEYGNVGSVASSRRPGPRKLWRVASVLIVAFSCGRHPNRKRRSALACSMAICECPG